MKNIKQLKKGCRKKFKTTWNFGKIVEVGCGWQEEGFMPNYCEVCKTQLQTLKDVLILLEETKRKKDELCQCKHSKTSHLPHQLDKHGGKCMICVHCPIYTWESFEFVDLQELKNKIKGEGKK